MYSTANSPTAPLEPRLELIARVRPAETSLPGVAVSGLYANSAGISVGWTRHHLEVRILPPQPGSRPMKERPGCRVHRNGDVHSQRRRSRARQTAYMSRTKETLNCVLRVTAAVDARR
jgi:hypothetical protein